MQVKRILPHELHLAEKSEEGDSALWRCLGLQAKAESETTKERARRSVSGWATRFCTSQRAVYQPWDFRISSRDSERGFGHNI